ncbi:nucleotide-binding domain-containing protein [Ascoidea rubescens DSM 1968]|uniref:Nucleotide-binding domain-containing protein n=1 Tax=Ascoidea rubescens DSM 1968 TaxID=1344418 RepID=A0A1D2VBY2_9ASCO|nr:nucleotide-binding domain-containing protein [Ascoidea rubescens DSM 1968]ODV58977.1 nucleotide-binding domain-containing protein [Ascoidea rubescens DSM 1968]
MEKPFSKDSKIIIIGAGIFGLSSALHLAEAGYRNIKVFDRLDFNQINYTFLEGADTASADINKYFRIFYADKIHYQKLAFEASEIWENWNKQVKFNIPKELLNQFNSNPKIFERCGILRLDDVPGNPPEEKENLKSFSRENLRATQYDLNNKDDIKRAKATGWFKKLDPLGLKERNKVKYLSGVLDSTGGLLYASNACIYCKYLCEKLNVKFILGNEKGFIQELVYSKIDPSLVTGIITKDKLKYKGDLVIMAAGPWSTKFIPQLDGINEATSGTVVVLEVPQERQDLIHKYSPENFPIVSWKMGHSREKEYLGGFGLFPCYLYENYGKGIQDDTITGFKTNLKKPEKGIIKILTRQIKYTNPQIVKNSNNNDDDRVVSIPLTSNSGPFFEKRIVKYNLKQIKKFLTIACPDLVLEPRVKIIATRLLWYTDTINNDFLFDYVPNTKNLIVTTGGSGHAFKFFPVLGRFTKELVEGIKADENYKINNIDDPKDFELPDELLFLETGDKNFKFDKWMLHNIFSWDNKLKSLKYDLDDLNGLKEGLRSKRNIKNQILSSFGSFDWSFGKNYAEILKRVNEWTLNDKPDMEDKKLKPKL